MDNLSILWESFSLTEFEGNTYHVHDGGLDGKFLLAARFFTGRKLLWHIKKGFEVRDMGNHRVLFLFSEEFDIDGVVVGEPWTFDKYLVTLKRIQSQSEMKGLEFDSAHFWI